jgi:hypothetical protein
MQISKKKVCDAFHASVSCNHALSLEAFRFSRPVIADSINVD